MEIFREFEVRAFEQNGVVKIAAGYRKGNRMFGFIRPATREEIRRLGGKNANPKC